MMKMLGMFKEFGLENGPSIKDSFSDAAFPNKDAVVRYLKSGKVGVTGGSFYIDVVTGKQTRIGKCIMTDGEYTWPGILAYYVDKYNLRLPADFEAKAMNN